MIHPMKRLICYFSANEREPTDSTYEGLTEHPVTARSLAAALLTSNQVNRVDRVLYIRPVLTEAAAKHEGALEAMFDELKPFKWDPIHVPEADADTVLDAIAHAVLSFAQPHDEVLIEPTLGPRSFSYGLFGAGVLLKTLRPDVTLARLMYAEPIQMGRPPDGKPATLSRYRVRDISRSMQSLEWALSAHLFADALLPKSLLERLNMQGETQLRTGLSAGLSPKVIGALRTLHYPEPSTPSAKASLHLVQERLTALGERAEKTKSNTLNLVWLEAELKLARLFSDADRLGDAARVLREWLVNVVLSKMLEDAACADPARWMEVGARHLAERWMYARKGCPVEWKPVRKLVTDIGKLRNPLSHAGYIGPEGKAIEIEILPALVTRAEDWFLNSYATAPLLPVPRPPDAVVVFTAQNSAAPSLEVLEAAIGRTGLRMAEMLQYPPSKNAANELVNKLADGVGWAWLATGCSPAGCAHLREALASSGIVYLGPESDGAGHKSTK